MFSCTNYLTTPRGPAHPGTKFPGHPRLLPSKPKEDILSKEGTNYSTTTPSAGRPPPHWAVSRPQSYIRDLFSCLAYMSLVENTI